MFQSNESVPLMPQSMIGSSMDLKYSIPKINIQVDPVANSERSPASFSGRTSHNSDSDNDEATNVFGQKCSMEDDMLVKRFGTTSIGENSFFNLSSQSHLEGSLDSRSSSGSFLLSDNTKMLQSPTAHFQLKASPSETSVQDRLQAQLVLERRLLQEQAKYQLLNEDRIMPRIQPSGNSHHQPQHFQPPQVPQQGQHQAHHLYAQQQHQSQQQHIQPRSVLVNEFYAPRQVNNTPVLPKTMSSVLAMNAPFALPHHLSTSSHQTQRIQSAATSHMNISSHPPSHGQLSPSALRFQQQMQQLQSQAIASSATSSVAPHHAFSSAHHPTLANATYTMENQNYGGMLRKIYQVQFKCAVRYFTLAPGAPETLGNGDFVVVEADRGEDVGVVTDVMTMKTFVDRRILTKASNPDDEDSVIGKIVRPATLVERQTLAEKFRSEESILLMCRELAYKTYRLPLQIHNVEYQFDRHKLTVYYTADNRVDFREFVRDLFAAYKARIWMKKLDLSRPVEFQQSAAVALATGMQIGAELSQLLPAISAVAANSNTMGANMTAKNVGVIGSSASTSPSLTGLSANTNNVVANNGGGLDIVKPSMQQQQPPHMLYNNHNNVRAVSVTQNNNSVGSNGHNNYLF